MWHCGVLCVCVDILIGFMQAPIRCCVWLSCIHLLLVLDIMMISSNPCLCNSNDVACLPKATVAVNFFPLNLTILIVLMFCSCQHVAPGWFIVMQLYPIM
jgi:hypothetical protein